MKNYEQWWNMVKNMMDNDGNWSWVMDNVYLRGQFPLEWDDFPHRCLWMLWEEGKQT